MKAFITPVQAGLSLLRRQRHHQRLHATPAAAAAAVPILGPALATLQHQPLPALIGSASLAMLLEERTKVGRSLSGSLMSFFFMACLANLGVVPSSDCPIYDACWSSVLPASLSLSVLLAVGIYTASSSQLDSNPDKKTADVAAAAASSSSSSFRAAWRHVALAYGVGALGSILGSVIAFLAVSATGALPPSMVCKCVAATAATYVGGSVNFFQVAKAVGMEKEGGPAMLGALAAADVFLMAVYFAGLLAMRRSQGLGRWLLGPSGTTASQAVVAKGGHDEDVPPSMPFSSTSSSPLAPPAAAAPSPPSKRRRRMLATAALALVSGCLAFLMGTAGQAAERRLRLPGSSAGLITVLSLLSWGGLLRLLSGSVVSASLVSSCAVPLTTWLFNLFFASIGAGATLGPLLASGPAVLALMGVTLAVHLTTTLLVIRTINNILLLRSRGGRRRRQEGGEGVGVVSMEEVIVASNANIGGPATAAALAGAMNRPDLVLPATAMGTLGYAMATALGLAIHATLTTITGTN